MSVYKTWSGEYPGDTGLAVIAVISGIPGFFQNFCVEGFELMGIHPQEEPLTESEKSVRPFSRGGEKYPLLPEFLGGMLRLATFTFLRTLIQRTLIPDTVSADEVTYAVTLSSYLCSSTASLATWGIGELILFRALKFHAELHTLSADEKQMEHSQQIVYRGRQRSETDVSISEEVRKEMSLSDLNYYETQKYRQTEARHQFRYSKGRLMLQGMTQFITPILIATVLEKSLKRLFTSHSHLDAEESLNNSQTLASLSTGLIVMMLGYLVDYLYGYKDKRLVNHLTELDSEKQAPQNDSYILLPANDEKKSDNRIKPEAKKLAMAEGRAGYDLYTFCELIGQLNSKQEATLSAQTNKIMGVLEFSYNLIVPELKQPEIIVIPDIKESKDNEIRQGTINVNENEEKKINNNQYASILQGTDEKTIETEIKHGYKFELFTLNNEDKLYDESETRGELQKELRELNNNGSLLLPYYCSFKINGESRSLPKEYGFLHFTRQKGGEIKLICYNPCNNQLVNLHFENYFERLTSEAVVKCSSLRTATPVSPENSAPWVIMQVQGILNKEIDLIARPHRLVPETNLSSVRLSQFSFLSQLPTVRNAGSTSMEMKPMVS